MELKRLRLEGVKSSPGGQGLVEARIAAVAGPPDADGDVLEPGSVGRQSVAIVPSHDHTSVPLGRAEVIEQGGVVRASLKFFLAVSAARDWFEAIKADFESGSPLQEWSWGYQAKSRVEVVDGRAVRFLEKIKMFEVSPVLVGASVGTGTLAVKARTGDEAALLAEGKRHADAYNAKLRAELASIAAGLLKLEARALLDGHERAVGDALERRRPEGPVRWYRIIPGHPDSTLGKAGAACVDLVAAELGIPAPGLSWIVPETAQEAAYAAKWAREWPAVPVRTRTGIWGACVPNRGIFVRADLPFEALVETVAHEVRHAAGGDEPAALAFGREWRRRITL